jgi:magnesium transporter
MNFKDMPELGFEYAYPTVLGIMVAACLILYWRFRKNGWL